MNANMDALKKLSIFAGLGESSLELLGSKALRMEARARSLIVCEGDSDNRLYLIHAGTVRVCKHFGTDREVELARLDRGQFFGEMSILDTLPRSATVQALTDSTLLSLNAPAFHLLYRTAPAEYSILLLNIARDLSRRLRQLDETFAALHL